MAELAAGSLRGCRNASVFIIGTGVGGGLIVDGRVVRGVHGTAGEFSFVNTNSQGWPDPRNYVASQCSTPGLLDIEKLAVGGGVSRQPILTGKIREAYDTLMAEYPVPQMIQALPRPEIVTCHFGGKANQVGAFLSYLNALKD